MIKKRTLFSFAILLVGAFVILFSNLSSVSAAVSVYGGWHNTQITLSSPTPNKVFKPGDTVRFTGRVSMPSCSNYMSFEQFRFHIAENKNIPAVDCKDRAVNVCGPCSCVTTQCLFEHGYASETCTRTGFAMTTCRSGKDALCTWTKYLETSDPFNYRISLLGTRLASHLHQYYHNFDVSYTIPEGWAGNVRLYVSFYSLQKYNLPYSNTTVSYGGIIYQPAYINTAPTALMSCSEQNCVKNLAISGTFSLLNNSTDPDGDADITISRWYTKVKDAEDSTYVLRQECSSKCNYNVALGAGEYTAKLYVQDSVGNSSSTTGDITIINLPPTLPPQAAISCVPSCSVEEGVGSYLKNDSIDPNGIDDIERSFWYMKEQGEPDSAYRLEHYCIKTGTGGGFGDFGDDTGVCDFHNLMIGPLLPGQERPYAPFPRGKYTGKLVITDSTGNSSEAVKDFEVRSNIPFAAISCGSMHSKIFYEGYDWCLSFKGYPLTLNNDSTDMNSTNPPDNNNDINRSEWYVWEKGESSTSTPATFCDGNPKDCKYQTSADTPAAMYHIKLKVYDKSGNDSSAYSRFMISRDVVAKFQCSLDNYLWEDCAETKFQSLAIGTVIYLKDITNGSQVAEIYYENGGGAFPPSPGAMIKEREWVGGYNVDDTPIDNFSSNTARITSFTVTKESEEIDVSLSVVDLADRTASQTEYLGSTPGNNPPQAAVSCVCTGGSSSDCNPSTCEFFKGSSVLKLKNDSTDLDGNDDIVMTRWYIAESVSAFLSTPTSSCSFLCDYVPQNVGNYKAKLQVEDAAGEISEAGIWFKVKQDISVDFECSLTEKEPRTWSDCTGNEFKTLQIGTVIYLKDKSIPSSEASISSRLWSAQYIDGTPVSNFANTTSSTTSFATIKQSKLAVRLQATDSNNRSGIKTKEIGSIPPPKWWPVSYKASSFSKLYDLLASISVF